MQSSGKSSPRKEEKSSNIFSPQKNMKICSKGLSSFKMGRLLGKGGYAKCYEVIDLTTKKLYAIKIVNKSKLVEEESKRKLETEIKLHKYVSSSIEDSDDKVSNITKLYQYFEDAKNVYILLELCENLSLDMLVKRRIRLREVEVRCYLAQIINGLKQLKRLNVIHRDLKLGNLFLTNKMEVKIGDFGLAVQLKNPTAKRKSVCGTPNYIAPEVLDEERGHSFEVDIWACGVIIYTLLVGRPPFETRDLHETYKKIQRASYSFPKHVKISDNAKDLISKCLQIDPQKRIKLDKMISHSFFLEGFPELCPVTTLTIPPSISYSEAFKPKSSSPRKTLLKTSAFYRNSYQPKPAKQALARSMKATTHRNLPQRVGL
ncbi:unnamed protein product [Moneuplotes crassus]|uniref:Protein kinase domain-containing protein n=1 Tax=Euplotes crassus TaxID=5936 RepID=A0AAD1XZX3_EUPCR|nr:unnamed protein product [Moneuplotes crassus]